MAENALYKYRGKINVVLARPAICGGSLKEPFPGWTDSLAAAGSLTLMSGTGVCPYLPGRGYNHFDIVPVDTVSNHQIVATAYTGRQKKRGMFEVYNIGTSDTHPIKMEQYAKQIQDYY